MRVNDRVVVAMSGGVDSSVAAAVLSEQGCNAVGLMMRLWSESHSNGNSVHNRCCAPDAVARARKVAAKLDMPFYVVDARDTFRSKVVDFFVDGYVSGVTPNPCLECNRHVRWDFLLRKALDLGATHLATGHYARVRELDGEYQLLRAVDTGKDQSYALSVLGQEQLAHTLFPVGEHTKTQVRELARSFDLPVVDLRESQDLCFLADRDYRRFLREHAPAAMQAGPIVDIHGQQLGEHQGLPQYTIGQRKGIGVAAPVPMYVVATEMETNTLVVGPREALGGNSLRARRVNWVRGTPPQEPMQVTVKIRYRALPVPAVITPVGNDCVEVDFKKILLDITPGQAAVFYNGEICLGGGVIQL